MYTNCDSHHCTLSRRQLHPLTVSFFFCCWSTNDKNSSIFSSPPIPPPLPRHFEAEEPFFTWRYWCHCLDDRRTLWAWARMMSQVCVRMLATKRVKYRSLQHLPSLPIRKWWLFFYAYAQSWVRDKYGHVFGLAHLHGAPALILVKTHVLLFVYEESRLMLITCRDNRITSVRVHTTTGVKIYQSQRSVHNQQLLLTGAWANHHHP